MKIAYLLSWELGKQDGVTKKVLAQAEQWLQYGHQVKIFCISKSAYTLATEVPLFVVQRETGKNILADYALISKAYKKIRREISDYNPDVIYHRSEIYQPELKKIMVQYPTVIEINSDDLSEFKELARESTKGKLRYIYYKSIRDRYLSSAAGFCCVTHEIAALPSFTKFKKPIKVVPNSLNPDKYRIKKNTDSSTIPKLIFMGSPDQAWHGVDKIITLAEATEGKLQIEVVGPSRPDTKLPTNINFHGFLKQEKYEAILESCDVGLCTLALHWKNMNEACPLKTREYLAYGLPIIIGYKDTAFKEQLPEWVLQLENTEKNVSNNIDRIVNFCYEHKNKRISKEKTSMYIDAKVYEQERVAFLENIFNHAEKLINQ